MTARFPNLAGPEAASTSSAPISSSTALNAAWKYAQSIVTPDSVDISDAFEFAELSKTVNAHLMNQREWVRNPSRKVARLKWIQGKPGQGKTTTTKQCCLRAGYHVALISPGTFAGEVEGASIKIFKGLMVELERWSKTHNVYVVLILDDFDTGIVSVSQNTAHTVNTDLLIGEMMQTADNSKLYLNPDQSPIPFFVTCNDATKIRSSLTRTGRSDFFEHNPTKEDRANFAWYILQPRTTDERQLVEALVKRYAHQGIAFWEQLPHKVRELHMAPYLADGVPTGHDMRQLMPSSFADKPEIVWQAAKLLRDSRVKSYLSGRISKWRRS